MSRVRGSGLSLVCESARVLGAAALSGFVAIGCAEKVVTESEGSGTGGARSSAGGETSMRTGGTPASGGTPATGGASSCDALSTDVEMRFQVLADAAPKGCSTDDDCVEGPVPVCVTTCAGPLVSKQNLGAFEGSVDALAPSCDEFTAEGCVVDEPPCVGPLGGPACVNGVCEYFLSQKWNALTIVSSPLSYQTDCSGGGDCAVWKLTPDNTLETMTVDTVSIGSLAPATFDQVKSIIESVSFRQGFEGGFMCDASSSTRFVMFTREDADGQSSQDVTGCIFAGPPGNDPLTIWNLVGGS